MPVSDLAQEKTPGLRRETVAVDAVGVRAVAGRPRRFAKSTPTGQTGNGVFRHPGERTTML